MWKCRFYFKDFSLFNDQIDFSTEKKTGSQRAISTHLPFLDPTHLFPFCGAPSMSGYGSNLGIPVMVEHSKILCIPITIHIITL